MESVWKGRRTKRNRRPLWIPPFWSDHNFLQPLPKKSGPETDAGNTKQEFTWFNKINYINILPFFHMHTIDFHCPNQNWSSVCWSHIVNYTLTCNKCKQSMDGPTSVFTLRGLRHLRWLWFVILMNILKPRLGPTKKACAPVGFFPSSDDKQQFMFIFSWTMREGSLL